MFTSVLGAVGYYRGHCGLTEFGSDTEACNDLRMTELVSGAQRLSHATSWEEALAQCSRICTRCRRCRFISVSLKQQECSWYSHCELRDYPPSFRSFSSSDLGGSAGGTEWVARTKRPSPPGGFERPTNSCDVAVTVTRQLWGSAVGVRNEPFDDLHYHPALLRLPAGSTSTYVVVARRAPRPHPNRSRVLISSLEACLADEHYQCSEDTRRVLALPVPWDAIESRAARTVVSLPRHAFLRPHSRSHSMPSPDIICHHSGGKGDASKGR